MSYTPYSSLKEGAFAQKNRYCQRRQILTAFGRFFHPESPERLAAIYEMLENPLMDWKFTHIEPREAAHKEIEMIHSPSYVKFIASTAGQRCVYLDPDTSTSPETYEIAKLAVGGVCNAIDSVFNGEVDNAFAFIRPPGHHAEKILPPVLRI